jgi:hypothetical protein
VWGPIEPRWLGTYEQELIPIIHRIVRTGYTIIIDVGSAEGYYSVGLAKQLTNAKFYSYDVDPWARKQQERLARLNLVTNLQIKGFCKAAELASIISKKCLLICDIEGYEYQLLDPVKIPGLRQCDMLVELHPFEKGCLTMESGKRELMRRYSNSHDVEIIAVQPRYCPDLPSVVVERLGPRGLAECMDEMRPSDQIWLWLVVRQAK